MFFNILINDLELEMTSRITKLTDDIQLFKAVKTKQGLRRASERPLHIRGEYGSKWQKLFLVSKCKVMHVDPKYPNYSYKLMGSEQAATDEERDVGVMVNSSIKMPIKCASTVKKKKRPMVC